MLGDQGGDWDGHDAGEVGENAIRVLFGTGWVRDVVWVSRVALGRREVLSKGRGLVGLGLGLARLALGLGPAGTTV